MKKNVLIFATLATLLFSASSCKKDDGNNSNTPTNTAPTASAPSDADGAFVVINTITYQTIEAPFIGTVVNKIELGTAAAWMGTSTSFVDAGTVTCNDSVLGKQANNSYVYVPKSVTGIEESFSNEWTVSGSGSVTGFNYTHSASFPTVDSIAGGKDVSTAGSYTLQAQGPIANYDSVIFVVAGPKGGVTKVVKGTSCTFTADEMASVGTGDNSGLLQIAPYRLLPQTINGKKYYFIKETCVSKFVNLK